MKLKEIVLTKNDPHSFDYKELTFKDFIIIQNAAQEVANNMGYSVYLVGSALVKHTPRDIDLVIIIPHDEYVAKYNLKEDEKPGNCIYESWSQSFEDTQPLLSLQVYDYKIDFKICPDNWFPEKEKILLAKPKGVVADE